MWASMQDINNSSLPRKFELIYGMNIRARRLCREIIVSGTIRNNYIIIRYHLQLKPNKYVDAALK
jgi:hypothetical protein